MKLAILMIILDLDWLHILFNIYIYFHPGNRIDDAMEYYRTEWSNRSIPSKLPCYRFCWKVKRLGSVCMVGSVESGEYDESSQLKVTNGRMQPTSRGLESILKEYCRCIHPESKQLNLNINFAQKKKNPVAHLGTEQ